MPLIYLILSRLIICPSLLENQDGKAGLSRAQKSAFRRSRSNVTMGHHPQGSSVMAGEKRRAILKWAAVALLCVVVAYPMSYAPVVRFNRSVAFGRDLPMYAPVDWVIDNTPLRDPLFAWARLWGVEYEFVWAEYSRTHLWRTSF